MHAGTPDRSTKLKFLCGAGETSRFTDLNAEVIGWCDDPAWQRSPVKLYLFLVKYNK